MTGNNKANSVDNKGYVVLFVSRDVKSLAFFTHGVFGDGLFSEVLHQIGKPM